MEEQGRNNSRFGTLPDRSPVMGIVNLHIIIIALIAGVSHDFRDVQGGGQRELGYCFLRGFVGLLQRARDHDRIMVAWVLPLLIVINNLAVQDIPSRAMQNPVNPVTAAATRRVLVIMEGPQVIVSMLLGGDVSIRQPIACKNRIRIASGTVLKSPVITTGISGAKPFILSIMSAALFCRQTSD